MAKGKNTNAHESSTSEHVTVEVVGRGEDQRELIHVPDDGDGSSWDLARLIGRGDSEPRADYRDVGERLGYARLHKFKELIEVHRAGGFINPLEVLPSRGETRGGRPGKIYMLSRDEIVYLIGKAETKEANRLMVKVAKAFNRAMDELWQRRIPQVDPTQLSNALLRLDRLESENGELRAKLLELDQRVHMDVGTLSQEYVDKHITKPLNHIAFVQHSINSSKTMRSYRRGAENKLRNVVCHNGKGSAWTNFPRDAKLLRILENFVQSMLDEAMGKATEDVRKKAAEKARQEVEARLRQLQLSLN